VRADTQTRSLSQYRLPTGRSCTFDGPHVEVLTPREIIHDYKAHAATNVYERIYALELLFNCHYICVLLFAGTSLNENDDDDVVVVYCGLVPRQMHRKDRA